MNNAVKMNGKSRIKSYREKLWQIKHNTKDTNQLKLDAFVHMTCVSVCAMKTVGIYLKCYALCKLESKKTENCLTIFNYRTVRADLY